MNAKYPSDAPFGVTISALLDHPDFSSLRRIAGDGDPQVSTIKGLQSASILTDVERDFADLIVFLDPIASFDWKFDTILRRLADAHVSVVVLADSAAISVATTFLSARLGIVLLVCPSPWETSIALSDRLKSGTGVSAYAVYEILQAIEESGQEAADVVSSGSRTLARQIHLVDSAGRDLMPSTDPLQLAEKALEMARHKGGLTHIHGDDGLVTILAPVDSGIMARSWLIASIRSSVDSEIERFNACLPILALAVGHRLSLKRVADEREARWRIALVGELLEAGETPAPSTLQRALELGWRVQGWHIGIRIVIRSDVDIVARRYEIVEAFLAEGLNADVVEQGDGWAAWLSYDVQPTVAEVGRSVRATRRAHIRWDAGLPSNVGVGRVNHGPEGIAASLIEAADAARLAASRPQSGHFLHVDRLGLAQLLLAWTQTDRFQPAALELLAPLRTQAAASLLLTLSTYLDAESSTTETAMILGIHRNTVAERIQRIQRLLGVDLSDSETRLALHLACRTVLAVGSAP